MLRSDKPGSPRVLVVQAQQEKGHSGSRGLILVTKNSSKTDRTRFGLDSDVSSLPSS